MDDQLFVSKYLVKLPEKKIWKLYEKGTQSIEIGINIIDFQILFFSFLFTYSKLKF
ncbi:hypothetical protein EZS27_015602 [termite gut metagenome]|uniref:Uncharacterized protein n=1 Tax=termite gut metagenome TaxID=433724 RepID=A0A5J4RRA3_9ZZZZ